MIQPEDLAEEELENIACPCCEDGFNSEGIRAHMAGHGMTDPVLLRARSSYIVVSKEVFERTALELLRLCTWEALEGVFDFWRQRVGNVDDIEWLTGNMMRAARREQQAARKAKAEREAAGGKGQA